MSTLHFRTTSSRTGTKTEGRNSATAKHCVTRHCSLHGLDVVAVLNFFGSVVLSLLSLQEHVYDMCLFVCLNFLFEMF